jgi:PTS system cellobiose-specific IIC component
MNSEKILESKFFQKLNSFSDKLNQNKFLSAYQSATGATMGILLVGAVFCIIAVVLSNFGVIQAGSTVYNMINLPYNMTMGLLSLFLSFIIAYNYAGKLKLSQLNNGLAGLICFLIVAAPVTTVQTAEGGSFTGMSNENFSASGMFVAMLVAWSVVQIDQFCREKNVRIKMPDVVPAALSQGFSAMLPLLFSVIGWYGISLIVNLISGGAQTIPSLIMAILRYPLAGINSYPGIIVLVLVQSLFWFLGIHGGGVVSTLTFPIQMADVAMNAALIAEGKAPVFTPIMALYAASLLGGGGNVMCLNLLGLRSKSEKIKAVTKAGLIPSLFSIGEPVIFGLPIMYNPILGLGFFVASAVPTIIASILGAMGVLAPLITLIYAIVPLNLYTWVCSGFAISWLVFILAMIPVGMLCYYPFFKIYEKQCVAEEKAVRDAEEKERSV